MAKAGFFRKLRILFLLFILLLVAGNTWLTERRVSHWDRSLRVVVYPINGDGSSIVADYIANLDVEAFEPIAAFMASQAKRHNLELGEPVTLYLAPEVRQPPPKAPAQRSGLAVMWWSLNLRYWASQVSAYDGPAAHVRLFVSYHDPANYKQLDHSLGLEKGLIGIINAYASEALGPRNNVVIAHELLHTLGATDKYDYANNQPLYPQGYAEPGLWPLYPQQAAEIMAGRIPLSQIRAIMPESLDQAMIGEQTGREIHWIP